jgi:EAL domain-containing protein (putative c-di-GMP-specific phosphodiesterase class I)
VRVSVNISGRQFWQAGLIAQVRSALDISGLDPDALCLEITEGALVRDAAEALATLRRLKEIGVKLAIDDFGTGYSSLQYLRQFPMDLLKVDRAFSQEIEINARDAGLTAAIHAMASVLGIEPLAEGVERGAQRDILGRQGYGLMQGFLFGKSMPTDEFETLLRAGPNQFNACPQPPVPGP